MAQYTREQFEKIYDGLPVELQEALFSVETADAIGNACSSQGVTDERGNRVAEYAGQVLMGLILPEDFQKTLEKEVGLKKDIAAAISRDITRFVFFPVKESLRQLHAITTSETAAVAPTKPTAAATSPTPTAPAPTKKKVAAAAKDDTYRETIE